MLVLKLALVPLCKVIIRRRNCHFDVLFVTTCCEYKKNIFQVEKKIWIVEMVLGNSIHRNYSVVVSEVMYEDFDNNLHNF